jgi:hypothetical protein
MASSDVRALIASLGSVERHGAGLRTDLDFSLRQTQTQGQGQGQTQTQGPGHTQGLGQGRETIAARTRSSKSPGRHGATLPARLPVPATSSSSRGPEPSTASGPGLLDSTRFEKQVDKELWPQHVRDYKERFETLEQSSLKLPVLHQLSPRSRRKLADMPTASHLDISKADKYGRLARDANPELAYKPPKAKLRRSSSSAPQKLKKLEAKSSVQLAGTQTLSPTRSRSPPLDRTQPRAVSQSQAVRPPETASAGASAVPTANAASYYTQFDEYRKKIAQKQAYEAEERAAQERREVAEAPADAAQARSFRYPADSKLGDGYAPMVADAVSLGRGLAERQAALDGELLESKRSIAAVDKTKFMDTWRGSLYDELGLDVDPAFNRRRVFGDAWRTLAYHVGLGRLRAALCQLRRQTSLSREGLRRTAGAFLSRILWGHKARRRVHTLRRNLQLQREAQLLHQRVEERYAMYNKLRIFKTCFSYRSRVKAALARLRMERALAIQCSFRIALAKARMGRVRRFYRLRSECARRVQTAYRRHAARRKVTFMRKYDNVKQWEGLQDMNRRERMLRHRQHGASYIVCRFIRAYLLKKRLSTLLYWHHFELAIHMQRVVRGHLDRVKCRRQITRFRKMLKLKIRRITLLQSLWRGRGGRRAARKARDKKSKAREERVRRKALRLDEARESSKLPRLTRQYLRWLHPFRYLFEARRAVEIQRVWRGHRGRRRKHLVSAMARVRAYFSKIARKSYGARSIQRVYRGFVVRKKFRFQRRNRMAVKIQTQCRVYLARKRVRRRRLAKRSSSLLYNMISRLYLCAKYRALFMHNLRLRVPIRVLQRTARRFLARCARRRSKDRQRFVADKRSSEALSTYRSLGCAQLALLMESVSRPPGKKPVEECASVCGREARCLGPVQALFCYSIAPGKALFDNASLPNNRIDSSACLKLMQRLPDIYAGKGVAGGKKTLAKSSTKSSSTPLVPPKKKKKKAEKTAELTFSLMECINRKIILLPKKTGKKLFQNDVDVAFNKAKSGGGNVLVFEDFCLFLQTIAVAISEKVSLNSCRSSFDFGDDDSAASSAGPMSPHPYFFPYHDLTTDTKTYGLGLVAVIIGTLLNTYLQNKGQSKGASVGASVAAVAAEAREAYILDVVQWLEDEARARVGVFVARIQRMVRRRRSKDILIHARAEVWRSGEQDRLLAAHVACQAMVRRYLTRLRVVKIAQLLLVRYVPHSGALYWNNPNTKVSSWAKPRILRGYDCVSIALPPPLLEYSVKCSNCTRVTAEVNCLNCGDSFCRNCYDSLHCKGKRRLHCYEKIPMCCRCLYQCATKNCATCTLRRPAKGSIEELVRGKRNFGNYCDTCFIHIHDAVDKGNTLSALGRTVASELESGAIKDAYLVGHALHQRVITNHKFGNLVQACEECMWRSAAWRCVDCDQVYCSKCLQGLHSIGGPFTRHAAEKLPYYPPSLHAQTLKDSLAMRVADKIVQIQRAFLKQMELEKVVYCIMLQAWWRMVLHGHRARLLLKRTRAAQRRAYRVRRYEDMHMRAEAGYKARDVFGRAPALKSDTREEKILKKFNVFRRQDIRRFIYQNRGDKFFVMRELAKLRAREEEREAREEEEEEERMNGGAVSSKSQAPAPKKKKYLEIRMPSAYLARPKSPPKQAAQEEASRPNSRPSTAEMLKRNNTKGTARVGFDCGTEAELMDQARRGGWRLPGGINMTAGARKHETSMDLRAMLRRGEYARVQKQLFIVVEVSSNSVQFNRVWRGLDVKKRVLYRLPSYQDDRWVGYYASAYKAFDRVTGNPVAQVVLAWQETLMGRIAESMAEKTKHAKRRGNMSGSQFWGRKGIKAQRWKSIATNLLADEIDVEPVRDQLSPYGTGADAFDDGCEEEGEEEEEIDDEMRVKMRRTADKRWEATDREKMERGRAEKVLTAEELALDADFWEEHLDPMTNTTYYLDKETGEYVHATPKSVDAKKQLAEQAIERQRSFESAKLSAKGSLNKKRR